MAKIGMVSLGCPKNRVDAEIMLKTKASFCFQVLLRKTLAQETKRKRLVKDFALCGERFRGVAPKNPTKGCEAPFGNPLF